MHKFLVAFLATTTLAITVGAASAADLPVYPSSGVLPGVPSLYSRTHIWTGIYVGANAGGAFGNFSANATSGPFSADLGSVNANGFIGGGQVGAQIQYQHVVYGIEGDFQGSSQDNTFGVAGIPVTASMPWFATVRGRLGWAVNNVLLYGTGGMAIVDGKISASAFGLTASTEKSHIGWTAGAGIEWAFAPHWSAKVEYLYLDGGNIEIANFGGVTVNGRIKDNIVRAGLNYSIFD